MYQNVFSKSRQLSQQKEKDESSAYANWDIYKSPKSQHTLVGNHALQEENIFRTDCI